MTSSFSLKNWLQVICLMSIMLISTCGTCNASNPYQYGTGPNNCYAQCPWNNTLITYLNTGSGICVTSCSSGTYADDSTKTCASSNE